MTTDDGDRSAPAAADEATERATSAATRGPRRSDDPPGPDTAAPGRRRLLRALGWVVAFALWSVLCVVWLFPLLTELGLDPTLGG